MSAWPEAVWIVKQLQQNFDFEAEIGIYTQNLQECRNIINNLNDRIIQDENNLEELTSKLRDRALTIAAPNQESITESYDKYTIWFITNE